MRCCGFTGIITIQFESYNFATAAPLRDGWGANGFGEFRCNQGRSCGLEHFTVPTIIFKSYKWAIFRIEISRWYGLRSMQLCMKTSMIIVIHDTVWRQLILKVEDLNF